MIDWTKSAMEILAENPGKTWNEEETLKLWRKRAEERKEEAAREEKDEEALANKIRFMGNGGFYPSKAALKDNLHRFHNSKILFDLILSVYTNDGYGFPRSVIQKAKSIAKEIPQEERLKDLPAGDPVTVYRADSWNSTHSLTPVKTAPSWTTNKNVAIWFAYRGRERGHQPLTLWKAEIPRDKIIAYLTDRSEFEVLQHNNVKNMEILPAPAEEEVAAAFEEHTQHCKESLEELNKWALENGYHTIDIDNFLG